MQTDNVHNDGFKKRNISPLNFLYCLNTYMKENTHLSAMIYHQKFQMYFTKF